MRYKILSLFGFGWSKWQIIEENKRMICVDTNNFTGYQSKPRTVYIDVLRKENKFTGDVKYKNSMRT